MIVIIKLLVEQSLEYSLITLSYLSNRMIPWRTSPRFINIKFVRSNQFDRHGNSIRGGDKRIFLILSEHCKPSNYS